MYAFACVIFETLCNADQWPWKGTQVGDIQRLVTAGRRPPFLSGSADDTEGGELTALMNKAWAQDASARPSFAQIEEDLKGVLRNVKGGAVTRFRVLSGVDCWSKNNVFSIVFNVFLVLLKGFPKSSPTGKLSK